MTLEACEALAHSCTRYACLGLSGLATAAMNIGQDVWYCRRFQPPQSAVVSSVDRSVVPVSYGIRLADGRIRDTEADRIFPRLPGEAGPSQGAMFGSPAALEPSGDQSDGFGDFEGPPHPSANTLPSTAQWQHKVESEEEDFGDFAEAHLGSSPNTVLR